MSIKSTNDVEHIKKISKLMHAFVGFMQKDTVAKQFTVNYFYRPSFLF